MFISYVLYCLYFLSLDYCGIHCCTFAMDGGDPIESVYCVGAMNHMFKMHGCKNSERSIEYNVLEKCSKITLF